MGHETTVLSEATHTTTMLGYIIIIHVVPRMLQRRVTKLHTSCSYNIILSEPDQALLCASSIHAERQYTGI